MRATDMLELMRRQADSVAVLASHATSGRTHVHTLEDLTGQVRRQALLMGADPGTEDELAVLLAGISLVALTDRLTRTSPYVQQLQRWAGSTPATLAAMALVGVGPHYRPEGHGHG